MDTLQIYFFNQLDIVQIVKDKEIHGLPIISSVMLSSARVVIFDSLVLSASTMFI